MQDRLLWIAAPVLALALWARGQHPGVRPQAEAVDQVAASADVSKRVVLSPLGLRYYEGDNMLELVVEMANGRRVDYIVYSWTPKAWIREMPEWCRYRRAEVLPEIKRLTADKRIEWVEQD